MLKDVDFGIFLFTLHLLFLIRKTNNQRLKLPDSSDLPLLEGCISNPLLARFDEVQCFPQTIFTSIALCKSDFNT